MSFDWRRTDGKQELITEWVERTKLTPRCALYLIGADLLDSLSDIEKELLGALRFPLDDTQYEEARRRVKELSKESNQKVILALRWLKDYENLTGALKTYLWCEIHEEAEIFLVAPLPEKMTMYLELEVADQVWPLVRVSAHTPAEIQAGCRTKELDFVAYQKKLASDA
ncbi:MAG: hypothetical protein Q7R79_04585 [bacterium]|nr:hypothetical protein [bacterium]